MCNTTESRIVAAALNKRHHTLLFYKQGITLPHVQILFPIHHGASKPNVTRHQRASVPAENFTVTDMNQRKPITVRQGHATQCCLVYSDSAAVRFLHSPIRLWLLLCITRWESQREILLKQGKAKCRWE